MWRRKKGRKEKQKTEKEGKKEKKQKKQKEREKKKFYQQCKEAVISLETEYYMHIQ